MNESIFISGFFSDNDQKQLSECCTELENYNISLKIRNLEDGADGSGAQG